MIRHQPEDWTSAWEWVSSRGALGSCGSAKQTLSTVAFPLKGSPIPLHIQSIFAWVAVVYGGRPRSSSTRCPRWPVVGFNLL